MFQGFHENVQYKSASIVPCMLFFFLGKGVFEVKHPGVANQVVPNNKYGN
jgi:hypothetical protein